MALVVYNTMSRMKEPFETVEPGIVTMYVCGVTVYSDAHIGHAMSAITFDVIRRYLEWSGYQVRHAQNFTDVDDKIINRAAQLGVTTDDLVEQLIAAWRDETSALNVLPATVYPRATQEIPGIIAMIEGLIAGGYAYPVAGGDVNYRVTRFAEYGKLSHRQLDDMQAGARIEVDPRKEHPMDFALWKAAKPGEPAWESPWGLGRPGWHIECSVMALEHLGHHLDIHGGGADLIFPHHENEIAQSEAFTHHPPMANFWVHNGLLQLGGEKMSKSIGNLVSIHQLLEAGDGQAFRFLVLNSHYRNPLVFNDETLESARRGLARMATAVRDYEPGSEPTEPPAHTLTEMAVRAEESFRQAMDDDFNTPVALASLFELARAINREEDAGAPAEAINWAQGTLVKLAGVLGLTLLEDADASHGDIAPFVDLLLDVRRQLRERKQWDLADSIRDQLEALGLRLEDTPVGTEWRRG
jgi:cysteinyl-tRNA synthetase